ncbi:Methyltransferase type 11 [Desulfurococcus mucosus DSM 2162]|uniref:Methyltransferase type 11 n=2 Tax=Desulfurococcus mucosus TaxID=2275 RepID=E8R7M5_DESM0|nr:class I SAM-dependent methyltransferase [Desulfurococcus mucosus]ADV64520.1 Methyltransferase type 11 [Desulfurococcus mucosus DSM 2162]
MSNPALDQTGGDDAWRYDATASSYDELYRVEQYSKYGVLVALLTRYMDSATLLDAGCGTGLLVEYLAERGLDRYARYICLDPSVGMISRLSEKPVDYRVIPVVGYAEEIPLRDSSIDIVVSVTAWSNIGGKREATREFKRVTGRGGLIIVSSHVKHHSTPPALFDACFKKIAEHIDEFYVCVKNSATQPETF